MKKWLLFDCMETIIDFEPLPTREDYFDMGFKGSDLSKTIDREIALSHYLDAVDSLNRMHEKHEEYPMALRYEYIVKRLSLDPRFAIDLNDRFFQTYKSRCLVKDEKRDVLKALSKKYKLGVISDFMVEGGIEALLAHFDLASMFDVVVTSIGVGHRKPHPRIYEMALELCRCEKTETVYIGDNYERDYLGSKAFGIEGIFYNPKGIQKIGSSIRDFGELLEKF